MRAWPPALLAALFVLAALSAAQAEITIRTARIGEGDLWVAGEVNEPNASISLDDSFVEMTDKDGRFQFRLGYHPATCTVVLTAGAQSRAVVIENCGQRGPSGPPGPPGPGGTPDTVTRTESSSDDTAQSASCGARRALYTGEKGVSVWVKRKGTLVYDNPLRPLSKEPLIVLDVTWGGKVATVYGSDFTSMLQGGPAPELQKTLGQPITWERSNLSVPNTIQIASESGPILARLQFKACGDPLKQEAAKSSALAKPRPPATGALEPVSRESSSGTGSQDKAVPQPQAADQSGASEVIESKPRPVAKPPAQRPAKKAPPQPRKPAAPALPLPEEPSD